jgi:hypothetical protein
MRRTAILLLLAACTKPASPPPPPQSCLDRELAQRHLNEFGDPVGTFYPGGTPLFDEATGRRMDRPEYVFAHHPDIRRACDSGP